MGNTSTPANKTESIFLYGNLCIDYVYDCAFYPAEDSSQRALSARRSLGGNGANSGRVLAQLRGSRSKLYLMGAVPRRDEVDTAFTLAALQAAGVSSQFVEEVGGDGMPTSFALTSQKTGTRTLVSTRNRVREMSVEHSASVASQVFTERFIGKPHWCHLECRQNPEIMLKMVQAWRDAAESQGTSVIVSFEVEKPALQPDKVLPILQLCDYVFFSQNFAEQHHDDLVESVNATPESPTTDMISSSQEEWQRHKALCFLRALRKRADASKGLWMCTWGEHGAFALDTATGQSFYEPAHLQEKVVDSVGAGDTFNAGFIHATCSGASAAKALHFACEVAGLKVAQVGFDHLHEKLPPSLLS